LPDRHLASAHRKVHMLLEAHLHACGPYVYDENIRNPSMKGASLASDPLATPSRTRSGARPKLRSMQSLEAMIVMWRQWWCVQGAPTHEGQKCLLQSFKGAPSSQRSVSSVSTPFSLPSVLSIALRRSVTGWAVALPTMAVGLTVRAILLTLLHNWSVMGCQPLTGLPLNALTPSFSMRSLALHDKTSRAVEPAI
jgi:hypothetical protein